jgi:tetratricopeptide (TPR) repeat protein
VISADLAPNPYPGLRPFDADEDHLFFGREREIDELLRRLRFNRFLSVVGTSGCGKSSLIRCGLISALHSGMMVRAGSSWRVVVFRPGEDPIGHLAAALDAQGVIGAPEHGLESTNRVLLEAALRRGPRGLVEAVRQSHIPPQDNLLVVVDQFEELFRFQRSRLPPHAQDDAVGFVKLLLGASSQDEVPIYVVITMRSDFIGDCMEYPGLPEALNGGQYLAPRMTRDALRSAIGGPAMVAGGQIAPRLVRRLLNDLGNNQDQLPVLQHALMRSWDHWVHRGRPGGAVDIEDYESIGTLKQALSQHAEEAYAEAAAGEGNRVTQAIFKALTDTVTDPRGTRRPCTVAELAAVAEVPASEIVHVVEIFRRPGRSFLMPPAGVALDPPVIVDLSHESLMRCWTRLIRWADEERLSAAMYLRLSRAAGWFEEGTAGLWRDPELELGLRWRRENRPTAAWARRYGDSFERTMRFLDRSREERDDAIAERRAQMRRRWRQLQLTAALLALLLLVAISMAFRARVENARAEENLRLARAAVDESLLVAEREPSQLAADFPELVRFRRDLLQQAQRFYREFVDQAPDDLELRSEQAFAVLRLADIDRALLAHEQAATRYRQAIAQLESLVRDTPTRASYRQALASAYNWLGETLRLAGGRFAEARDAYVAALRLQERLQSESPEHPEYRRDLARTHYNRGILYALNPAVDGAIEQAESDFRRAIRLLEPLAGANAGASQELARAYNNLGNLRAFDVARAADAREPYLQAIRVHEELAAGAPENREYALELVKFYNNLAYLLRESGEGEAAAARNRQALSIIEALARPAPSLSIERADTYNLRGRILQDTNADGALDQYRQAFEIYRTFDARNQAVVLPEFHIRFGDLLVNLAFVAREQPGAMEPQRLLSSAVEFYLAQARRSADRDNPAEARSILDTLETVLPALPPAMRRSAEATFQDFAPRLRRAAGDES